MSPLFVSSRAWTSQSCQLSRSRRIASSIASRASASSPSCSWTSASWRYGAYAHGSIRRAPRGGVERTARIVSPHGVLALPEPLRRDQRDRLARRSPRRPPPRRPLDTGRNREAQGPDRRWRSEQRERDESDDGDDRQLPHPVDARGDEIGDHRRAERRGGAVLAGGPQRSADGDVARRDHERQHQREAQRGRARRASRRTASGRRARTCRSAGAASTTRRTSRRLRRAPGGP